MDFCDPTNGGDVGHEPKHSVSRSAEMLILESKAAELMAVVLSTVRGTMNEVTRIINAIEQGDPQATEKLLPLVYEELRLLAAQKMAQEKPGQTFQATALVHEAYLRLVEGQEQSWNSRGHFFRAAAEAMRRILVENARRKKRLKRGGGRERAILDETTTSVKAPNIDFVALDEALAKLEVDDPEKANVVKLRYFAGLTNGQAAEILNVSTATANRHWSYARSWLFKEISKGD